MGFATHLGPWLLGTVKNTIGTSPSLGQVRNIGATVVTQSVSVDYTQTTFATSPKIVIPAGSLFLGGMVTTLSPYNYGNSDGVLTVYVKNTAGTYIAITGGIDCTAPQKTSILPNANSNYSNVFLPNPICASPMTFTFISSGSGTTPTSGVSVVTLEYAVRNPDGSTATSYTA